MKVYILIANDMGRSYVDRVFANKADAEKARKESAAIARDTHDTVVFKVEDHDLLER